MRISDWSSYVCASDHLVQVFPVLSHFDSLQDFAARHEDSACASEGEQLSPQARILLDVNDSPLRRSQCKSVDDEKRLKFSLDGKQSFDHGPHDFVPAIHVPIPDRSEEHTSELQSLMRISYAVFCLKKKK